MTLKYQDYRALLWYAEAHDFKPQLSATPKMYFKNNKGKLVTVELPTIKNEYERWKAEDRKERDRVKKQSPRPRPLWQ